MELVGQCSQNILLQINSDDDRVNQDKMTGLRPFCIVVGL